MSPSEPASAPSDPTGRGLERITLGALLILFTAHVLMHVYQIVGHYVDLHDVPWTLLVPVFAGFSLAAALALFGPRHTATFFVITCVISYLFEFAGERTGLIFGRYHYSDVLGPKLGPVPAIIPLAYFMLAVPAYVMTNLILDGRPAPAPHGVRRLPAMALLTALIMTAWDISYDPLMFRKFQAWIWDDGGAYFGVPFQNFVGWLLTCFIIVGVYGTVARSIPVEPAVRPRRWIVLTPIASFAILGLGDMLVGEPVATRILAPFTMGIAILAALLRLYGKPQQGARRD